MCAQYQQHVVVQIDLKLSSLKLQLRLFRTIRILCSENLFFYIIWHNWRVLKTWKIFNWRAIGFVTYFAIICRQFFHFENNSKTVDENEHDTRQTHGRTTIANRNTESRRLLTSKVFRLSESFNGYLRLDWRYNIVVDIFSSTF